MTSPARAARETAVSRIIKTLFICVLLTIVPVGLAVYFADLLGWNLSIPLAYTGGDDVWQLVLTKVLVDTGWILYNPFLGAPDIASWHHNAAAQTSALHSVLMLGLSAFVDDAVRLQQTYYLLNFSLIAISSYVACRLLTIGRIPAVAVGLLLSFTAVRFNAGHYSFIANYFAVPLALVPLIWLLSGRYAELCGSAERGIGKMRTLFASREFLLGLLFICIGVTTDGYFAFFLLLLFGFGFGVRLISGAWRQPLELFVPSTYLLSIVVLSVALQVPLIGYKNSHPEEFTPNGVEDTTLIKHPFEAEVYSTTLKMLIAPPPDHRVGMMGKLGGYMLESSENARQFKTGGTLVPLGLIASILLIVLLALISAPVWRGRFTVLLSESREHSAKPVLDAFISVAFFSFLCSIMGGIGSLVALVFPTIRAYDRFPVILMFVLFAGAAFATTCATGRLVGQRRIIASALILIVAFVGVFDQVPVGAKKHSVRTEQKFLAERRFVHGIEGSVDPGSMIYQYPHSQYLQDNAYYGWGSFAHVRLYLHSKTLRWSNGASKNSPVENWHLRVAAQPMDELVDEIIATGFAGIVIDRSVVPDDEYKALATILTARGMTVVDDDPSKLAFAKLPISALQIQYGSDYREPERLIVKDRTAVDLDRLPSSIDRPTLANWLNVAYPGENTFTVERRDHADMFVSDEVLSVGSGARPALPLSKITGTLSCRMMDDDQVEVTLNNSSAFDLTLKSGRFPYAIGVHLLRETGEVLQFDDGLRLPLKQDEPPAVGKRTGRIIVERGKPTALTVSLATIVPKDLPLEPLIAQFALVQDGNAWFNEVSCKVPVSR